MTTSIQRTAAALAVAGCLSAGTWCPTAAAQPVSADEQLIEDVRSIPVGMGALLVPALTRSGAEPPVLVMSGGQRIASGRTGQRIVVPPGRYQIRLGHGPLKRWATATVRVQPATTTQVKPFVGALRVNLINDRGKPVSGSYVLRSLDSGALYGPVSIGDGEAVTKAATWLVPPGRYALAVGNDAESNANRIAFSVHAGEVLRYRLVVDDGDLLRADLADTDLTYEPSIWRLRWTVGGSAALDSRDNPFLSESRQYLLLNMFSTMQGAVDVDNHLALFNFNVDQAFIGLDSELGADIPLRSLNNEAELELLYTYRAARVIGPYVRAVARTSFAESHYFPETDVDIDTHDEAGNLIRQTEASRGDRVRLFKAVSPVVVQQGVGPSLTVVDNDIVDLTVRAGGSARQAFYRDGRFITDRQGDTLSLVQVDNRIDFGGEATATAGIRIGKAFSVTTKFDAFFPVELFSGDIERFPFRWDSTASLRLGRYASANYNFSLRRQEAVVEKLQLQHGLVLTLQSTLF